MSEFVEQRQNVSIPKAQKQNCSRERESFPAKLFRSSRNNGCMYPWDPFRLFRHSIVMHIGTQQHSADQCSLEDTVDVLTSPVSNPFPPFRIQFLFLHFNPRLLIYLLLYSTTHCLYSTIFHYYNSSHLHVQIHHQKTWNHQSHIQSTILIFRLGFCAFQRRAGVSPRTDRCGKMALNVLEKFSRLIRISKTLSFICLIFIYQW